VGSGDTAPLWASIFAIGEIVARRRNSFISRYHPVGALKNFHIPAEFFEYYFTAEAGKASEASQKRLFSLVVDLNPQCNCQLKQSIVVK
jgi:hypothetical protein